jgi:hypothetical protein
MMDSSIAFRFHCPIKFTAKNLGPFWTGTGFYIGQYRLKKFFYPGTCVAAAEKIIIAT